MTKKLRTLGKVNIEGKTVIVRANLDVPIENGEVKDDTRIKAAIPTLKYLIEKNCKIVLIGHLGRPEGKYVDELSLMPIRFELGRHLEKQIKFVNITNCENSIKFLEPKDILLLENVRFSPEEESSNSKTRQKFIEKLCKMGDIYVNDCFGLYRKHASVYELASCMKKSFAGFAMQAEIEALSKLRENPEKPYVAIIGGAKLDTKIDAIKSLVKEVDVLMLGGALAYTFMKAKGIKVGASKVEKEYLEEAAKIITLAEKHKCELLLPVDHIAGKEFNEKTKPIKIDTQDITDKDLMGLDIGPKTIELYQNKLSTAKSILWNGPLGVFEWSKFANGTQSIGDYITLSTSKDIFKVAGGGDTTYAINKLKIKSKRFDHISNGGGMMLEFLSGKKFEVLELLENK